MPGRSPAWPSPWPWPSLPVLPTTWPGCALPSPCAGAGRILAVDEAVFLDPAQRDLDDAVLVFADDRFFGDDVGDIFANRFANFLAMAQAVAGRAIGALGIGDPVFAKDGIAAFMAILARARPLLYAAARQWDARRGRTPHPPCRTRGGLTLRHSSPNGEGVADGGDGPIIGSQSFQRLLAAYFSTTSTHDSQ